VSRETFAIIIVAALFGLFVLLVIGAFLRSRRAATVFREAARGAVPRPAATPAAEKPKPKPDMTRREFFRRSLLTSFAVFGAEFGAASLAFIWPVIQGGFGGVIDTGLSPEAVKDQIRGDRQPFYYGAGRFYLINYEGQDPEGVYEGLMSDGIMALYQKCVHLGCRVPFCEQSQWFECPCHGSKYNRAGEYRDGPAPRGMDRFAVRVESGSVVVDTSLRIEGPPRGTDTIEQDPEGPFCINIGGE
jgi:cytochrome b6-f complex iron-sulfur subunit